MPAASTTNLAQTIKSFPGTKIVTVLSPYLGSRSYDMRGPDVGYHPDHELLFQEHVQEACEMQGVVVVRCILPGRSFQTMTPRGPMDLPVKRIYGAFCNKGSWRGMQSTELEFCYSFDPDSGEDLANDPTEELCDWPA